MAASVRKFGGQRFLGRLSLILLVALLCCLIVRSGLVCRFNNDKRISGSVGYRCPVSGSDACRVRFGALGKTCLRRPADSSDAQRNQESHGPYTSALMATSDLFCHSLSPS